MAEPSGPMAEPSGAKEAAPRDAYRAAGVDVEAGERAVALMRDAVASTRRPEVVGGLGGFAGAIEIPAGYRRPVLVASTDGVGTKVALARRAGRLAGLGIDLVAMCADDVACAGAEPLFLLDYVAVGRLVPGEVATVVAGVAAGCRLAGCALLGGETAEHPGVMRPDDLDLAATCVGRRGARRPPRRAAPSPPATSCVGLPSSGLHSNGFSLVRRAGGRRRPGPRGAVRGGPRAPRPRRAGRGAAGRPLAGGGPPRAHPHLRPRGARDPGRDPGGRPGRSGRRRHRPPRDRPRDRRRPAGQRAADRAGRAGGTPGPGPLDDAVGHAPAGRARRARRRGAAGDVQRRPRDGPGGAAGVPWTQALAAAAGQGIPGLVVGEVVPVAATGGRRYEEVG